MINGKTCLAIIVARGGSKGLPGKNVALLGGKPMLAWSIAAAQKSKYLDRVILSSDDVEIIDVAKKFCCEIPFYRPAELAEDDTPASAVIIHALNNINEEFDYFILLQATSPLRSAEDIDGCIEACYKADAPAAISVTKSSKPPEWMLRLTEQNTMVSLVDADTRMTRRQKMDDAYVYNGAVYVAKTDWFIKHQSFISKETQAFIMPRERSVDIDELPDLLLARAIVEHEGTPN